MSGMPYSSRWLALAVKARQWALDEQGPALRHAAAQEALRRQVREQVEAEAAAASEDRSRLLARSSFDAAALVRQSVFEATLERSADAARAHESVARNAAAAIRTGMEQLLAERDALRRGADRALERVQADQQRVMARELDELWLMQQEADRRPCP